MIFCYDYLFIFIVTQKKCLFIYSVFAAWRELTIRLKLIKFCIIYGGGWISGWKLMNILLENIIL